jgi:RsiW-degrading membrane proteinase PrsW (M82 family)
MSDQWFYLTDGVQGGPVDLVALGSLAAGGTVRAASLMWREGMADWIPASAACPELFAPKAEASPPTVALVAPDPAPAPQKVDWFYLVGDAQKGPAEIVRLQELGRTGEITRATLVWKEGLPGWGPAGDIPELAALLPAAPPTPPGRPTPPPLPKGAARRGFLGGIGARISEVADLPTISNVPIRDILIGGIDQAARAREDDVEDEFAVGTRATTPPLSEVQTGWPRARTAWRILAASLLTYVALRFGISEWGNTNFIPGMAFVGSFVVPFAVVILFFELNTPRNVSIYQVVKMTALGGVLSLISTMLVFQFISGSGTGGLIPALLTGVGEETGKMLALLLVVGVVRYRWQLNGLLFGAAVGAGFAGLESAGYAFNVGYRSFVLAVTKGGYAIGDSFAYGLNQAIENITLRGLLAPGGHVIWTAMIGSAIWKVKGSRKFSVAMLFDKTVMRRWGIAVVLHGLWDADIPFLNTWLQEGVLIVVGWYIVFAILKDAFAEIEAAKAAEVARI